MLGQKARPNLTSDNLEHLQEPAQSARCFRLVFAVKPAKVLAFGKGTFSQTRYRPS